jgi:hypothetical protein
MQDAAQTGTPNLVPSLGPIKVDCNWQKSALEFQRADTIEPQLLIMERANETKNSGWASLVPTKFTEIAPQIRLKAAAKKLLLLSNKPTTGHKNYHRFRCIDIRWNWN